MNIGDKVMVRPSNSMLGGRWATVTYTGQLIQVKLDSGITYNFEEADLVTEKEWAWWNEQGKIYCNCCGNEITGELTYTCDDCKYSIT